MTPVSAPDLYDALNCAAIAIDEAGSDRMFRARAAHGEAITAASRAFGDGTPGSCALEVILIAASPARDASPHRAALWHALNGASLACFKAKGGLDAAVADLLDATFAANAMPREQRNAFRYILDAIAGIAVAEGAVAS